MLGWGQRLQMYHDKRKSAVIYAQNTQIQIIHVPTYYHHHHHHHHHILTFDLWSVNIVWITNQTRMMTDMLQEELLNALRQYRFVESPLWRMADGRDHVKIEVTFRKATSQQFDKKGVESKRRPTPPAGEWPHQPATVRWPTTTRLTPARRPTPCIEKETPLPAQTLPDTTRYTITHDRTQKTPIIEPTPTLVRPPTTPPTPDSLPKKKTQTKSPTAPARKEKYPTSYISYDFSYPLHEKYYLQVVTNVKMMDGDVMIVKGQCLQRPEEMINVDLPAFFRYQLNARHKK